MRVEFKYTTGYCGMDNTEEVHFEDNTPIEVLDDYAWEGALQNAESFGIYPYPEYEDEISEEQEACYSYNIEGSYKIIKD